MPKSTSPAWQTKLTTALRQDPKKTGVLGALVLIFLTVSARMMIGLSPPAPAAGSLVTPANAAVPAFVPSPVSKPGGAGTSLRGWLSTPIPSISRNDFLVKSDYFPANTAKTSEAAPQSGFWITLEKSLSLQADQKEKRESQIASLKQQAAALRLTSTVMGSSPRAMVNGALVGVGESVESFRVVRIEPRGIVVQRDGIQLAIPME
jgi:hypothetical protein